MSNQEWHYLWIKTLVQHGMAVESAEAAFQEIYDLDTCSTEGEPILAARAYLAQKTVSVAEA